MIPFGTLSTANLTPSDVSKNPSIISKTQILSVLKNFTISVIFAGKFATIWWKKFTFSNVNEYRERNWQTSGKNLKRNAPFDWKILFRYFINMAQTIEWHVRLRIRFKINVREEKNVHLDTPTVSLEKSTATALIGNLELTVPINCKNKRRSTTVIFSSNSRF